VKAKVIQLITPKQEINLLDMDDAQKYRYWQTLTHELSGGGELDDRELSFYERFPKTDTYRVIDALQKDLAEQTKK